MRTVRAFRVLATCLPLIGSATVHADWPTYLHDNARSGVTAERLEMPLNEVWVFKSRHAPMPAWPAPAKQDIWHELRELRPVVTYDRAFHVAIGDSPDGPRVYFGSSADDKVYCLDAATGEVCWTFFTEGPVRLAPTVVNGKVYFGSDDGWAYCLDATDGNLVWRQRPALDERRIPGNGRVISYMPARTGVLVDNGVAYYGSGLFPSMAGRISRNGQVPVHVPHWKHILRISPPSSFMISVTSGATSCIAIFPLSARLFGCRYYIKDNIFIITVSHHIT